MKKNFKSYALIWAIFLVAFNAVVFLVRPIIPGYEIRYDARFWIAWLFVVAAFVGNLLCANKAFQAENLEKLFYKVPLISVSYRGLIGMLVLGGALLWRAATRQQEYTTTWFDLLDTVSVVRGYARSQEEWDAQMEALHADLLLGVSLILLEIKGPDFFLRAPKYEA